MVPGILDITLYLSGINTTIMTLENPERTIDSAVNGSDLAVSYEPSRILHTPFLIKLSLFIFANRN